MLQMETFLRNDVFPSWFGNALTKVLSVLADQFQLTQFDNTHVQMVASPDAGAAIIAIGGLWRWMEASITVAHPGGAAGTYPMFVVAKANDITNTPLPFSDDTDYTFGLQILAPAHTPTLSPGVVDVFRQVGNVVWDGAKITRVDQLVPYSPLHHGRHEPGGPDALSALTDASFASANKDGVVGLASLRTLGQGAQQAQPGDLHLGTIARAYVAAVPPPLMAPGWQKIPLDMPSFDNNGCFDFLTHRYNVPKTGYYLVSGNVDAQINSSPQTVRGAVYKNGSVVTYSGQTIRGGTTADEISGTATDIIYCNAGDYLELYSYNSGPINLVQLNAGPSVNYLSVCRLA